MFVVLVGKIDISVVNNNIKIINLTFFIIHVLFCIMMHKDIVALLIFFAIQLKEKNNYLSKLSFFVVS